MPRWVQIQDDMLCTKAADENETRDIAFEIANCLQAGDIVALIGDLGAGKTRFVKAVAQEFQVPPEHVNSPTFTLIHEYEGRVIIRHCDTYRLHNAEEFADLGLDELFAADGIALVEWADRVDEYLPRDRLQIRISIDSPTTRTIEALATGKRSRQILNQLNTTGR